MKKYKHYAHGDCRWTCINKGVSTDDGGVGFCVINYGTITVLYIDGLRLSFWVFPRYK